jgi:beta-glucosidase-like glycosyl hydrolase/CubicO group peptidase (beta-lactamase class C family)
MTTFRKAIGAVLTVLCMAGNNAFAQSRTHTRILDTDGPKRNWVDNQYSKLTQEERIGQLMMVAAYSGGKLYNEEAITALITAHQIGGLTFMQGGPVRQAMLTNRYQHMAQTPLLISMDAEWGLGMRLDSVRSFPRQMMLGATRDTDLVFRMGLAIAAQCKRLGVHIDFAPDVDVNNNAANPVINTRSFGEDKNWVARLGIAYMRGLQRGGVIASAKHFPGHGNTSVDSHKDLPLITASVPELDTLELYPFKRLIAAGVKSVMVAHLQVPALDTEAHVPTSLSKNAVTGLLRNKMGYNGLIITDALRMDGVAKYFPAGEAALRAFAAGNDILLFPQDVPEAIARIKNALDSGLIPATALEHSVKKILGAKYDAGLSEWKDIDTANLADDLNKQIDPIREQAATRGATLLKDDNQIMNKLGDNMRVAYIGINADTTTVLYESLHKNYARVEPKWMPKGSNGKNMRKILESLHNYNAVIVALHNVSNTPGNSYGMGDSVVAFLQEVACKNNVLVALMGNAYAMQYFCGAQSVLVGYEDDSISQRIAGDILMKKIKARGKLPVTACIGGKSICPAPMAPPAIVKDVPHDLRAVLYPKDAGVIDQTALDRLDMFMARNIADGVFPGCRLLAARDGKVFFDKAFGYMKYDKKQKVDTNTLYDVASCTKMLATNIAVMRLYEQGKLDLEKTIGDYLPKARGTNKAPLKIKDLLLHQAGMRGWIPFYKEVVDEDGSPDKDVFKKKSKGDYTIEVARNLYMRKDYIDTMWSRIYASPLDNAGKSVYSDLDFIFLAAIVQQITGKPIDKYAEEQFYKPLGLKHIAYNPLSSFDTQQIAPTEWDLNFRRQTLRGYVHDPGAAMMGGVAGHAGLFATAGDAAVIFQLLLNKGTYGGTRYFKAATVEQFTAYGSKLNHRGLGFDKPATDADNAGPAGDRTSGLAFGHQGFTGTCVWADPATGIVFVFLSNRVHPSADNTKINKQNVRTVAQDYIYESIGIPVNHNRMDVYKKQLKMP